MSDSTGGDPGFVDDDDVQRCGVPKTTGDGDPCQIEVPNGVCHVHGDLEARRQAIEGGDVQVVDGVGSGTTSKNALADGGGPDDGNKNAMRHGLYAVQDDPAGTLDWLEDHRPQAFDWVISRWESFLADAPFDRDTAKADDLLTACLWDFAVRIQTDVQVVDGLTQMETRATDSGATFDVEVEHAGNLPADRLARRSESVKRNLGVLDDPESQKADAMTSWGQAAQQVAQRRDGDDQDPSGTGEV